LQIIPGTQVPSQSPGSPGGPGVYYKDSRRRLKSKVKVYPLGRRMTTPKDPPAPNHHLRIELSDLSGVKHALNSFEWAVSVVEHITGKSGEHPHLHVWLAFEKPLTKVAAKDRLRKHSDVFKSCSGNQNWSFRPHDSYTSWCTYVCKNISHEVLKGDATLYKVSEEAPKVPIVANGPLQSPGVPPARVVVRKSRAMREKFIDYCKNELHWKVGAQFVINDETTAHDLEKIENTVIKAANIFWELAFSYAEGERMCRHALWVFSCDEMREVISDKVCQRIKKSLW